MIETCQTNLEHLLCLAAHDQVSAKQISYTDWPDCFLIHKCSFLQSEKNVSGLQTFVQTLQLRHIRTWTSKILKLSRCRCLISKVSNQHRANLNANFVHSAVSAGFKTLEAKKMTHLTDITKALFESLLKTRSDFILHHHHHLLQRDVC